MVPIAAAYVPGETKESWEFFFDFVAKSFPCLKTMPHVLMSDRGKALVHYVEDKKASNEHNHVRHVICVKHLQVSGLKHVREMCKK